ncbi:MAG TPA: hypothetical protein ENI26_08090 [Methylophaga aminisulfidivorans]|uniref:Uncharacterized protein n=2 Tax=root TaxID=1 RepID=A0A7C1W0X6_9GAMM|nr:hypothetical protein [Methylophaga sp.]HEC74317.1 hypothetical protein [Methylophaga aminisulfidivorans]
MIALPTFEPTALDKTYQQFDDVLAFNEKEKRLTGEIGLFLNSLNLLDAKKLSNSVQTLSRGGINEVFREGISQWDRRLSHSTDERFNYLSPSLGLASDSNDNDREKLLLSISTTPYAYDIKPLSLLSQIDRNVVVRCIAEIRSIFLYNPNVTDLIDFAGYRVEIYEYLDDFLPKKIKTAGTDAIEQYLEENQDKLEFYSLDEMEEVVEGYCEFKKPFPKWVAELDKGIGKDDPFKALSRLKRLRGKSHHKEVVEFLNKTINSISEYLKNFPDIKSWSDYLSLSYVLNTGVETDDPPVDMGYMLAWVDNGFWWDIQSDVFNNMMEAGETPTFYGWVYGEHSGASILTAERIYRGAALFTDMALMTESFEQNLPDSKCVDNES